MRVNFINAQMTQLAIHIVGNKIADEGIILSKSCSTITNDLEEVLSNYFLGSFTSDEYFHLYHETSLNLNEVFAYASEIFNDSKSFLNQSKNLAKHLYNQSLFPNIKEGEFYVVYFQGIEFDGQKIDAIGLFKTEKKNIFLKTLVHDGNVNMSKDTGIDVKKLDKGCLIFNKDKDNGFVISVVDNTNKGNLAKYWTENFLHAYQINDTYTNTENIMSLANYFVKKELSTSEEITKTEQIDFLSKSLQYFKERGSFNINDFEDEVIINPTLVEKFREYKQEYETSRNISIDDEFRLSESAIKKQQRSYKRAITLDKKIQIIINGDLNQIERGVDNKGKFYKIYYRNEE